MYESFYSLSSDPFRLLPDPEVCFPHRSCAKAWAYLRYALKRGEGIVVVTGPPGSGKTTLAERLLNELNPAKTVSVRLIANELNPTDLLRKLAYSFGLPAEGMDRAMLAHSIERYLIELEHSSRQALVLIDEAQTLSHQSLEAMRLLTDLQSRSKPVLQLFLLGQEELEGVMSAPGMAQFQQRVIASSKLSRMDLAETKAYLEYRLGFAEWAGDPTINGPAVLAIFRYSRGLPRHVNKICSRLLLHGCTEEKHTLKQRDVMAVVQDLRHELLAPMENEPKEEVDLNDSSFDSVYELALVPAPRPVTPTKSTQQNDLSALFLSDETVPQSDPAMAGAAGSSQRTHRSHYMRGRHYYRAGRPRKFGFRRRVYHLFRLPRVLAAWLWEQGARWIPSIGDSIARLMSGSRTFTARAVGLSRDRLERLNPGMKKLVGRLAALPGGGIAGLAGVLVAAVVIATWVRNGDNSQQLANSGSTGLQKEPLSYDADGGGSGWAAVLVGAGRYLDVAELPVGKKDYVSSALSAESALREGMVAADVADYRGLLSSDPGQLLLGRTSSNVADGVIGRVAKDATTIDVWSLANKEQEEESEAQAEGVVQTGPSIAAGQGPADERDDDESIALIVSDETGVSLDFVRFLPAPAAGIKPRRTQDNVTLEPTGSGQVALVATAGSVDRGLPPSEPAPVLPMPSPNAKHEVVVAQPDAPEAVPAEPEVDAIDQAEINRLLGLADAAIKRNRLLVPRKQAAYTYLQQVLKIDPENQNARSGIRRIVRRYHALAKSALDERDFDESRRLIERGLRLDRKNSSLLALRRELDNTIAEIEAAELAAAELARMAMQPPKPKPAVKRKEPSESSFSSLMRLVNGLSSEN